MGGSTPRRRRRRTSSVRGVHASNLPCSGVRARRDGTGRDMLSPHGVTTDEADAMRRALVLAATPGIRPGVNPRVGCVLLRPDGGVVAEGTHRGAGTPHAEVEALERAGGAARGATAVVTLEPCDHTGRTGPCTQALLAAGIARVVFAQTDTHAVAAGCLLYTSDAADDLLCVDLGG